MNTIIDLYNKLLVYDKNNISFIIDTSDIIWFRLADITNILNYKSRKDVIKGIIDKKYKKALRNIDTNQEIDRNQPNTVYMTKNKYPKGMHFYVLKDDGMYKIGYTKDLTKRLATYNTGNANKAEYSYYKKTECAKEIEECMKALLNEYIYKSDKEFYKCILNKILTEVRKCFRLEKTCKNCKDIQKGGGVHNENKIIMSLLSDYENKYNNLMMKCIIQI